LCQRHVVVVVVVVVFRAADDQVPSFPGVDTHFQDNEKGNIEIMLVTDATETCIMLQTPSRSKLNNFDFSRSALAQENI
jgi:hypothetical protein